MRMFGYYAIHTLVNQIKKLLKTWVLIFLIVCFVIGGVIGFGAATISEMAQEQNPEPQSQEEEPEEPGFLEKNQIDSMEMVELVSGGLILALFAFEALQADKNGSKIFMPADVNLLFASPMKPQSVLLFRLSTQLGLIIFASLYVLLYGPALFSSLGFTGGDWIVVMIAWALTLALGQLLKVLLYTVCSSRPGVKRYLSRGVYAVLAVIGVSYFVYWKTVGGHYLNAAISFFNAPFTRFIPFWGWLKGICMYGVEENWVAFALCLCSVLIGGAVFAYIIWHIHADFYEDAMAKSQETAAMIEKMQSDKPVIMKRKKDRSVKLKRDGMSHGSGANVFFVRSMYNRFRFAHLGIFTKTSETYLVVAVAVSLLCRYVIKTDLLLPVVLTLGVFVFFRAMGNPLAEDTGNVYFTLIPESMRKKLFWSLMGGSVNCLLDLVPAAIAAVILGCDPLILLAWIPLLVSVDFFSTTVGTFIGLSVPVAAGKMVKQMVQVIFIYFGLLPDIAIMAVGIVQDCTALAAAGCVLVNIGLGMVFFFLSPLFLEPEDGRKSEEDVPFTGDLKVAKRTFSRLAFSGFAFLGASTVLQLLLGWLTETFWPAAAENSVASWVLTFAPVYIAGVPAALAISWGLPHKKPEQHGMSLGQFGAHYAMCEFMMICGNILGMLLVLLIQWLIGTPPANPIMNFLTDSMIIPKLLVAVVLAPIMEELIFRKLLIDRMQPFGSKLAVVVSAVLFGLAHGNINQMFYAAGVGLILGYVYISTGRLRYSILLHMSMNFTGGVVAPMFLSHLNAENPALTPTPWLVAYCLFVAAVTAIVLTGLVCLCLNHRKTAYPRAELKLPKGTVFHTVCCNPGMILLALGCLGLILQTFFAVL